VPRITIRGHSNQSNHDTSTNYTSQYPSLRLISHDHIHLYGFALFSSPHISLVFTLIPCKVLLIVYTASLSFSCFWFLISTCVLVYLFLSHPLDLFVCLIGLIYCALTSCLFLTTIVDTLSIKLHLDPQPSFLRAVCDRYYSLHFSDFVPQKNIRNVIRLWNNMRTLKCQN